VIVSIPGGAGPNEGPIRVDLNNIHNLMLETFATTLGLGLGTMNPL